jgi:HD-GYP domain-containing protein (c-di-GMP phosphodiesterase class II)
MNKTHLPLPGALNSDSRMSALMKKQEIPVICRRKSTEKLKKISFRALHDNNPAFWKKDGDWDYFISKAHFQDLKEILAELDGKTEKHYSAGAGNHGSRNGERQESMPNFGPDEERINSMKPEERVIHVMRAKEQLEKLALEKPRDQEKINEALAETTRDAALANRSTLIEALQMGDEEAQRYTQELVDNTRAMVKSSTGLVESAIFNDEMIGALVNHSNGTVVQHMTRVYLSGVSFLTYYNRKMLSSSLPNRIRINFQKQYKSKYQRLLHHLHPDDIILERVFHTGMQAISEAQLHTFATGFLIHDIGKAKDIEYHEGEAAYNREIVVDHVRQGYIAVMQKTNYPREAGLITGYHHEYYGSESGYGFYRALLANARKQNPKLTQDYCIAFTMEPLIKFQALSYFPAKVMEIVDVYDALTDPNRKYKTPLSPEEAITLMRSLFVEEELKIDPILFDLFSTFVEERMGKAA